MKRQTFMAAAVATIVAAILASCSSDNSKPLEPTDQPTADNPTSGASAMSGGGWSPVVEAASQSSNKVTICHSGNGKNYTQITVSVQGAAAHLGDSKNGKGGHENDYRVSANTTCPPPATPSNLQVCKVAGPGVINTANFTFVLTANGETKTITVPAGAGPNGNCVSGGDYRVGTTVSIHENAQQNITTTSIVVSPIGAQQGTPDLPGGNATVVIGTGTTTVTYTNRGPTGSLVICKVAGTGVTAGTSFTFTIPSQSATVAAGAAPNGTCATTPLTVGAGNVTVTEAATAGVGVTAVTATNGAANALVSSDLNARTATVTITAGQTTTVTYTNSAAPANGTLIICKIGGTGVAAGTNFSFTVGGQERAVAAGAAPNGTCSTAITLPAGAATVTEAAVANTSVQAITGTPTPTNINLTGRSATVQITAGQETRITFTNVSP